MAIDVNYGKHRIDNSVAVVTFNTSPLSSLLAKQSRITSRSAYKLICEGGGTLLKNIADELKKNVPKPQRIMQDLTTLGSKNGFMIHTPARRLYNLIVQDRKGKKFAKRKRKALREGTSIELAKPNRVSNIVWNMRKDASGKNLSLMEMLEATARIRARYSVYTPASRAAGKMNSYEIRGKDVKGDFERKIVAQHSNISMKDILPNIRIKEEPGKGWWYDINIKSSGGRAEFSANLWLRKARDYLSGAWKNTSGWSNGKNRAAIRRAIDEFNRDKMKYLQERM